MREIIIAGNFAGQRLNKFLMKYLDKAPSSFVYKMLRKKNIKLNDKKADGSEIISEGDNIKIYLSDETIEKFQNTNKSNISKDDSQENNYVNYNRLYNEYIIKNDNNFTLNVLYIDEDIMAVNKPVGILSQRAKREDYSINDAVIDYTIENNIIDKNELNLFKPSICNRLDRNTSGIIFAGISLKGSQMLTKAFKERSINKYYYTIVKGHFDSKLNCKGYITRDSEKYKSDIITESEYKNLENKGETVNKKYDRIETYFYPISTNGNYSLIKVKLITGKTHQIRAHLAQLGFYIIGDKKYGDVKTNSYMQDKYGLKNQLLHAGDVFWEEKDINVHADLPDIFIKICEGEGLRWQLGIQEA
ncbi:MAG: RluA family pseudouridine synthase [Lachnospiraceae bacterium]|nr:RluA family pseudouridine synthase [Lachnospiraceae bacterium]